jgi:hypothetical protein
MFINTMPTSGLSVTLEPASSLVLTELEDFVFCAIEGREGSLSLAEDGKDESAKSYIEALEDGVYLARFSLPIPDEEEDERIQTIIECLHAALCEARKV